jgi:hypothetical protein
MRNRPTARHILTAALFLSILTPMTGAHADGALDNTFGNTVPKNGILTLAGSLNDNLIFNDLAAQGNKTIVVGSKASDLIVVRIDSSGVLDPTFGSAGVFLYDTNPSSPTTYSAKSVAVDSISGSIYVLGSMGQSDLVVLKLTINGTLDTTFSGDGIYEILESAFSQTRYLDAVKIMLSTNGTHIYVSGTRTIEDGGGNIPINPRRYFSTKIGITGDLDVTFQNQMIANNIIGDLYNSIFVAESVVLVGNSGAEFPSQKARIVNIDESGEFIGLGLLNFSPTSTKTNSSVNWSVAATDIIVELSTGDIITTGYIWDTNQPVGDSNRAETFIYKTDTFGVIKNEANFSVSESYLANSNYPDLVRQSDGKYIVLTQYLEKTDPVTYPDYWEPTSFLLRYNSDLTLDNSFDGDGLYYLYDGPPLQNLKRLLIQDDQKLLIAGGYGDAGHPDLSISPINGGFLSRHRTATPPTAPTIGTATTASATSATVTFTAPASNGGSAITSYTATSSPGSLTGTLAGATAGTITVTGLTTSTAYTFTVTATNSEGISTASVASNSITTFAITPESGGPGPVSTAAADELRRQQDAAAAEKQRKDKELTETLALVPVIAGLAQELAGLGDSILKPKKCVKGKSVKKVSSTAKCPKGFKVKR